LIGLMGSSHRRSSAARISCLLMRPGVALGAGSAHAERGGMARCITGRGKWRNTLRFFALRDEGGAAKEGR
jgi:hypothetical protein